MLQEPSQLVNVRVQLFDRGRRWLCLAVGRHGICKLALVSVERRLLIEELLRERCLHELFQEDEKSRALAPIVEEYSGGAWRMTAMLQR